MPGPGPDGDRRVALRAAKLAALVRDAGAAAGFELTPTTFPGGAALVAHPGGHGTGAATPPAAPAATPPAAPAATPAATPAAAWVYADESPLRALGGAVALAQRQAVASTHLVVDDAAAAGHLARRARLFATVLQVHHAQGRSLVAARPSPAPSEAPLPDALASYVELIRSAGADPVWEHGVLAGEVYGLEVCRVVDAAAGDVSDRRGVRLEVGVGAADREAFRVMHGDHPGAEQVIELVHRVSAHRAPGAEPHALNRLGAERRLRSAVVAEPSRVGARSLVAASPPLPRTNLKDPVPCFARGTDADGTPLVVAFATGVDLDVVPAGADARAVYEAELGAPVRLVIAVPERDAHPALARVAGALREPAEVRTV